MTVDNNISCPTVLTAALRKSIASLGNARERRATGQFVAEGTRCVMELLPHMPCRHLLATDAWLEEHPSLRRHESLIKVTYADIRRMSQQEMPQQVMAVYEIPQHAEFKYSGAMVLALDNIQNPGNLGTIIRLADWFGITDIIASRGTVDAFNPKVVQATMGALARVKVHYVDSLADTLKLIPAPVYGTFLDGRDLYNTKDLPLTPAPVIVMGNEGAGISDAVEQTVSERLRIPSFPPGRATSESLNVAMATGIIVSELSRRIYG